MKPLTDSERELIRYSYIDGLRQDTRQKMKVVTLVLTCAASLVLGLIYHFLTR